VERKKGQRYRDEFGKQPGISDLSAVEELVRVRQRSPYAEFPCRNDRVGTVCLWGRKAVSHTHFPESHTH